MEFTLKLKRDVGPGRLEIVLVRGVPSPSRSPFLDHLRRTLGRDVEVSGVRRDVGLEERLAMAGEEMAWVIDWPTPGRATGRSLHVGAVRKGDRWGIDGSGCYPPVVTARVSSVVVSALRVTACACRLARLHPPVGLPTHLPSRGEQALVVAASARTEAWLAPAVRNLEFGGTGSSPKERGCQRVGDCVAHAACSIAACRRQGHFVSGSGIEGGDGVRRERRDSAAARPVRGSAVSSPTPSLGWPCRSRCCHRTGHERATPSGGRQSGWFSFGRGAPSVTSLARSSCDGSTR